MADVQHAVTNVAGPFPITGGRVQMVPLLKDNLSWVVICDATGQAAVVDGPPDAGPVLDACEQLGVQLTTLWNTHTHWDHIGINQDLAKRGLLDRMTVYGPSSKAADVPGITHPVGEGDQVRVGDVVADVWLTEGHLDGHISFVTREAVFCGDTLFAGGCGFLFDGPPLKMHRSLLRLASLPGDTRVCCAHEYTEDNLLFARFVEAGNPSLIGRSEAVVAIRARGESTVPSTIETERATNPFLRTGSPEIRESLRSQGIEFVTHADVFAALRALKDKGLHKRS